MVPECSRLVRYAELVQERITRRNGALSDTDWTIGPISALLEQAVPLLREYEMFTSGERVEAEFKIFRMLVLVSIVVSVNSSMTFKRNVSP